MLGRALGHAVPQEAAQRERVGAAPGDPALAVDPFEETDEQHAHVHARRNARASFALGVEARATLFHEPIEARLREDLVQPLVERVARRTRQLRRRDPQVRLLLRRSTLHRHRLRSSLRMLLTRPTRVADQRRFFNGLLGMTRTRLMLGAGLVIASFIAFASARTLLQDPAAEIIHDSRSTEILAPVDVSTLSMDQIVELMEAQSRGTAPPSGIRGAREPGASEGHVDGPLPSVR